MAITPIFSSGYICPQRIDQAGATVVVQEVVEISASLLQLEEISAAITCPNGDPILTDITLIRRNSKSYQFTVVDNAQDPVVPVSLTDSIVKFAVKRKSTQANLDATIFKASYDSAQIAMTDPVAGVFTVHVLIEDTDDDCLGSFVWDANVTRRDGVSTNAGTMDFTAASASILCTDVDFDALQVGDIVVPAGANTSPFTVISADEATNTITTDRTDFTTETGASFVAYRGKRDTVAGGTFTITADQAR